MLHIGKTYIIDFSNTREWRLMAEHDCVGLSDRYSVAQFMACGAEDRVCYFLLRSLISPWLCQGAAFDVGTLLETTEASTTDAHIVFTQGVRLGFPILSYLLSRQSDARRLYERLTAPHAVDYLASQLSAFDAMRQAYRPIAFPTSKNETRH